MKRIWHTGHRLDQRVWLKKRKLTYEFDISTWILSTIWFLQSHIIFFHQFLSLALDKKLCSEPGGISLKISSLVYFQMSLDKIYILSTFSKLFFFLHPYTRKWLKITCDTISNSFSSFSKALLSAYYMSSLGSERAEWNTALTLYVNPFISEG